ncbi:methyl-accepting chemotaxis protein [Roseivivax sediminis]|uniref:Methyl-accepting chemotaxis sensory transducer with Pas/Pac sensor n=1 Tax=Roseivivax sediminis TaxID=936889 RepID=A0A1I1XNG3_9RHOB|nr:methyl-accepting chemotaxis protein [Roseivivax sediminis]SFE08867.1 methyl-accepting chemotaxis sensory transducer with Pas/Pac sensor [Roseivivax sediminis]
MRGSPSTSPFRSIFVTIAALCVLSCAIVALAMTLVYSRGILEAESKGLRQEAENLTTLVGEMSAASVRFGNTEHTISFLDRLMDMEEGRILGAVASGPEGEAVTTAGSMEGVDATELAREAMMSRQRVTGQGGLTIAEPLFHGGGTEPVGALVTHWTDVIAVEQAGDLTGRALLVTGLVTLAALAATILLYKLLLVDPVRTARDVIGRLSRHEYDFDVPQRGRADEIGDIARALDGLREQLVKGRAAEREAQFQGAAFRNASAALMMVDNDLRITAVNGPLRELFHLARPALKESGRANPDPEALVGCTMDDFHGNASSIRAKIRTLGESGMNSHIILGNRRIDLRVNRATDVAGDTIGYVLEWIDISDVWFKNAMADAIESSQLMCQLTTDGRILRSNELFAAALNSSREALADSDFGRLVTGLGTEDASLADTMSRVAAGTAFHGEIRLRSAEGRALVLDGSLTRVADMNGKVDRLFLLARDVTTAHEEIKAARMESDRAEAERITVVDKLRIALSNLSDGDLTARIEDPFAPNYEDLRVDFNAAMDKLETALVEILDSASNIRNETGDISNTADSLSKRTESTAATLEQTAAALDMLTNSVRHTADGATQADKAVSAARVNAEESGGVVVETVAAMDQIASSSEEITSIIKVIDDIAFQTNLLALNAGVEAARAGDAGRGFAVVASEVRALAQRSSDAAREIKELIAESGSQVQKGVDLVGRTGKALQQIANSVTEISTLVSDIAGSAQQQSINLEEINGSVTNLDQSTQQVAARLEETTAASEALRNDAVLLVDTLARFKLRGDVSDARKVQAPTPLPERAVAGTRATSTAPTFEPTPQATEKWADF